MPKKNILATAILVAFLLIVSSPVIARNSVNLFTHSIDYRIGGKIYLEREFGEPCVTGAVKKQIIDGYGDLTKVEDVIIAPYIMSVSEKTDWSTAANAVRKLSVTTTVELCARPMVSAYKYQGFEGFLHTYSPDIIDGTIIIDNVLDPDGPRSLSVQGWATYVATEPGNSGSYHANFIAAYGPGPYEKYAFDTGVDGAEYDREDSWWFKGQRFDDIRKGDYYVGNYFNMDQYAYTSGGELKRFFSMSSPFSQSYIQEDLEVVGMAEVKESFNMESITRGRKGLRLVWWELLF